MRFPSPVVPALLLLAAVMPTRAHQGDDPSLGDPATLVHACQRTSASGRVRLRFVSATGTCPSNPAWQALHWPKVPPSVAVQDISARVINSVEPTIASNATGTELTFDSELYDDGGLHSAGNPECLTAPTAGKYLVYANVQFQGNVNGFRHISVRNKTTSTPLAETSQNAQLEGENQLSVASHAKLAAGDCIHLVVAQTSGGPLNIRVGNGSPEFGMAKLP